MDGGAAAGGGGAAAAAVGERAGSTLDAYEVMAVIGKGSFGTVSKIRRKADGRIMVWKELNYGSMREKEKQLVVSEVNILRELRHPFIVRYYDRIIDKAATRLYIVMEFCEGGDLGAMIKRAKRDGTAIDEEFIWKVFAQAVMALKECHRRKEPSGKAKPTLHRDLKPGNIFLDAAQNIKIGDFGLAKELASESKFAYTNVGTPFYMSPEMINEMRYNEKSDIWALGCLLYEMAALVPPFEATNHLSLAVKINAGKFNRIPMRYSEDLFRAIRWMIQVDYTKRPAVEDLEKCPRVKIGMDRAAALLREYAAAQAAAQRAREAAAAGAAGAAGARSPREEELARREADVARREAAVTAAERSLREREAALAARTAEVARREASLAAAGMPVPAAGAVAPMPALGARLPAAGGVPHAFPTLHRAYSAGDVMPRPATAPAPPGVAGMGMAVEGLPVAKLAAGGGVLPSSRPPSAGGMPIPTAAISLDSGAMADPTAPTSGTPMESGEPLPLPAAPLAMAPPGVLAPAAVNGFGMPMGMGMGKMFPAGAGGMPGAGAENGGFAAAPALGGVGAAFARPIIRGL